ncbi:GtrA family protein [Ferruginibacter yonginensis]|uniref:GtrA family protein n=1 Tax=Ferruginibacter yonginensis TaxID=1310416 RepID=A0ABV8QRY9_9BACT
MKKYITAYIDFFYPPFKKLMPVETFRYLACGSTNMVLGLALYYCLINFYFHNENVTIAKMVFKPHNAALFISFCFNFLLGFLLNKFVVFTASSLRGRIQLFRYFLSFFANLCINYFLLKILVEFLHIEAFIAQFCTTLFIVTISYVTQKYFTFKKV